MRMALRGCTAAVALALTPTLGFASDSEPEVPTGGAAAPLPGRPAKLEPLALRSLPKEPLIELGAGPLLRTAHVEHDLGEVPAGGNLSPGVALLARVPVFDVFSVEAVAGWSRMSLDLASGDFVSGGAIESMLQDTFSFELTMTPAIHLGDRVKVFGMVGIGFLVSSVGVTEVEIGSNLSVVADRERWHFSVPVGGGAAFHLVPDWLELGLRIWISPTFADGGDGTTMGTVYDGAGSTRALAPMPAIPFWITQSATLGVVL